MRNYHKGNVEEELILSTLAGLTLLGVDFDDVVSERTLISSLVATYGWTRVTQGTDVGPILVGIAHNDYTDAEIEAWIETTNSWDVSDNLATREISKRLIRRIGILETPSTADRMEALNDGKPIKTKLNWTLQSGQTLKVWAYNQGAAAFATTSPKISVSGWANLWTL